jgi:adenosine kinase
MQILRNVKFSTAMKKQINLGRSKNLDLKNKEIKDNEIKTILGIGSPLIDICAETNSETLTKYGLEFGRTVLSDEQKRPFFNIIEKSDDVTYIPGGSVCNSIRVTNWMLKNNENYKCAMLGSVGNDTNGQRIIDLLDSQNIIPLLEIQENKISGRCAVGIYNKERCLMPELNASGDLTLNYIESMENEINKHECLLVEGYFVDKKGTPIVKNLVENFQKRKKPIVFTLSAVFIIELYYNNILEIGKNSDIIFCNKEEAECFSKMNNNIDLKEISLVMHRLLENNNDKIIIITCGEDPVIASFYSAKDKKIEFFINAPSKIPKEQIIDTNGCGDSFVGGFLAKYIQNETIEECLKAGNWASSVILRNIGCSFPEKCEY